MIVFFTRAWHAYVGNAVAVRDYRSQLRGNKAIWIWGFYLFMMISLCGLAYSGIINQGQQSISSMQGQLTNFYYMVMSMLGAVVTLAAPALTASAVTVERQRRSLDLIFSSPVPPRYLLVGKLIGGFRYLAMLIVLSLPITAVCVVMGGATWSDVIGALMVLLSCGLVLMAMGLTISSVSVTTISATITTYLFTAIYVVGTSIFAVILTATRFGPTGMSRSNEAVWTVALNPFSAAIAGPTFTRVGGFDVPNWAFGLVFALALSRLLLAGAGSALSPFGSMETKTLRIQGLVFSFLLAFLSAVPLSASLLPTMLGRGGSTSGPSPDYFVALLFGIIAASMIFLVPNLSCFGRGDVDQKYRNDWILSLKGILLGTPSGGLPYLVLIILTTGLGIAIGTRYGSNRWPGAEFWAIGVWALGYVVLWWGMARYLSSFKLGLRGARTAVMAGIIILMAVPVPIFFMIMAAQWSTDPGSTGVWRYHLLYPLSVEGAPISWIYGIAMTLAGALLVSLSQANIRRISHPSPTNPVA